VSVTFREKKASMRTEHAGRWPCYQCGRWLLASEGHYQKYREDTSVFACHEHDPDNEKRTA